MADGKARNWYAKLIASESRSLPMGPVLTGFARLRDFRSFSQANGNYIEDFRHSRRLTGEY